ncbi:MAG: glycine cleavage system protein GcvH [Rhodospirillales bacterium]
MAERRFSREHEWIEIEGGIATIGITDYAQGQLGDVVFVELPEIGRKVKKGEAAAVVESVKAASEVFAPVSGEVMAVNRAVADDPAKVNAEAEKAAWFFKVRLADPGEAKALMDRGAYDAFLKTLS